MLLLAEKVSEVSVHMLVAFGVTYAVTGSTATGGLAAVLEPICNVLLMPLHEQLWAKLRHTKNHSATSNAPVAYNNALT